MTPTTLRLLLTLTLAFGMHSFVPFGLPAEPPLFRLEIEGATGPERETLPGIQPRTGESESELNRQLLDSFGDHPYGSPESPDAIARRQNAEDQRNREAREALLFRLEARALKRAADSTDALVPALIPSRRFLALSRTLKNPQLLRDHLESRVQRGELSPYDLLDAEQGLFDPTRNQIGADPLLIGHSGGYASGRPLPSPSVVRELVDYQAYIRAERYARQHR